MKFSTLLITAALSVGVAQTAAANSWTQAADYNTASMLYQLDQYFGSNCMAGDPYACQSQQGLYQDAQAVESAAYSCLNTNDQSACYQFQNMAMQVGQLYNMAQQQASASYYETPGYGAYGGGYDTSAAGHMDRMQQIHDWGQNSLAIGAANSAAMDASHERFMSTIND